MAAVLNGSGSGRDELARPAGRARPLPVDSSPAGSRLRFQTQAAWQQDGDSGRSGCFCNPGVRETALGLGRAELASLFCRKEHLTYEQFLHLIADRKQGALRVSIGLATNFSDVYHFLQFAQSMVDRPTPPSPVEQISPPSHDLRNEVEGTAARP